MASAIELWDQVMTVSVEPGIDALFALRNDPYASAAAIEICREALNNSAKHGRATQATIKLSIEQSDHRQRLTIEIVDNGRAPGALGTGLGSKTLNELSLNWNVVVSEQGAVLRAEIPIKFASEPVQTPH
jgi:anti-sigma regulatory factor (Ser/Thr protein kinase)